MPAPYYALITPLGADGRPDNTLPGGGGEHPDHGFNPDYPSQGLPGRPGRPPAPGHLPARPGRPIDPGFGHGRPDRPDQGLPRPPWQGRPPTVWPPNNVDPDWGVDAGEHPDHPIYVPGGGKPDQGGPVGPDNTLPAVPGHPPPEDAPPGTVYPPIAGAPAGKAWLKTETIPGVGHRYVMAEFPATGEHPDQGLPGSPGHPDQGLPGQPPRPDQGLPGGPNYPSQGLPPAQGRPDQGLPPTAQPRR